MGDALKDTNAVVAVHANRLDTIDRTLQTHGQKLDEVGERVVRIDNNTSHLAKDSQHMRESLAEMLREIREDTKDRFLEAWKAIDSNNRNIKLLENDFRKFKYASYGMGLLLGLWAAIQAFFRGT